MTSVAANARFARARGVNFHPFVPCRSIRANNRPRGQSERRATLICQRWLTCSAPRSLRGCRLLAPVRFRAVSFRHTAFPDQPLEAEKHTGAGWRETETERQGRKRKSRKQTRASQAPGSGFGNTSRHVAVHSSPGFLSLPCAISWSYSPCSGR